MSWLWGRKAAADVRPLIPEWLSGAAPDEGFASGYAAQVDEVFKRNPVGQRAVRLVAGTIGGLTVHSAEGDDRAAEIVRGEGLLEGIAANLLLHGNAYVQVLGGDLAPMQLVQLRPERVSVVADDRGWPTAYLYRVAGQASRVERSDALGRQQVAHLQALSPRDDHYGLGCLDAAIAAARDIALAFGVPPVLVGLPGDSTYANAREAGRALYRQTVLPMADKILRGLSGLLGEWLGPVRLEVDADAISELNEDRAMLWEQVNAATFLSDAEKREQLGFEA